jgi:hypothetical protein
MSVFILALVVWRAKRIRHIILPRVLFGSTVFFHINSLTERFSGGGGGEFKIIFVFIFCTNFG